MFKKKSDSDTPETETVTETPAPSPDETRRDRLFEAVKHISKGGTMDGPDIQDLLDFLKPGSIGK